MSNVEIKEPQKPDSAYGLFFRDTQAAIKSENPNVTFDEVSSVVSSMWASLSPEGKKFYKVKTEKAKDKYIKLLAIYRANVSYKKNISQGAGIKGTSVGNSSSSSGVQLQPQPDSEQVLSDGLAQASSSTNKPMIEVKNVIVGSLNPANPQHKPSSDKEINITTNKDSAFIKTSNVFDILNNDAFSSFSEKPSPSNHEFQKSSPSKSLSDNMHTKEIDAHAQELRRMNLNDKLDMIRKDISIKQFYSSKSIFERPNRNILGVKNAVDKETSVKEASNDKCLYDGCLNPATYNPRWNSDYCSNECVVSHCRNIFESFLTMRSLCPS